jgi:peptidoglycan/LPS O-acetylase OafA/YrhL
MNPVRLATDRIPELDVLRGIAAVVVMLYHYCVVFPAMVNHTDYQLHLPYGVYAVHLFFMISGFVITMTLEKTRRASDFLVSRFSRLYPVFWVAVLLTQSVVSLSPQSEFSVSWKDALINLTMLAEVFRTPLVDNVYWSLVIELDFYLLIFSIWKAGFLPRIERFVIPWCLIQIGISLSTGLLGSDPPRFLSVLLLLKYAHLFLAGILFYRIRIYGMLPRRLMLLAVCLVTGFVVQGVAAGCCSILFFLLFLLLASNLLGWIAVRPLVFLGSISYSLYLVHQNIGFEIMLRFNRFPLGLRVALAICIVTLLSWLLRTWVEIPSMRLIRNFYHRHFPVTS